MDRSNYDVQPRPGEGFHNLGFPASPDSVLSPRATANTCADIGQNGNKQVSSDEGQRIQPGRLGSMIN